MTSADVPVIASDAEAVAAAAAFAAAIRPGAIARDAESRLPHAELGALAATGLLGARVPRAFGGAEVTSVTVAEVFRLIAVADPAVAQVPQNHFAFVETIVRSGSDAQQALFLPQFLAGARLGNALSERGGPTSRTFATRLTRQADGSYRLNGRKYYSTGALTAQIVPVFALDDDDRVAVAYVPRDTPGLSVEQDWNAFGQRSTFSGTTELADVHVRPEWVLHGALGGDVAGTFAAYGQIIHAAIEVGIARGALDDGVTFLRDKARPWFEAGVERAADDEHLIRLAGELDASVRASEALLVRAGEALDLADASGDPDDITDARLAVAASKAFAGDVALDVTTRLFDFSGASAADAKHGLDRHWRNARTHTLHDPARSKHVHLGRFLIDGVAPPPSHPLI